MLSFLSILTHRSLNICQSCSFLSTGEHYETSLATLASTIVYNLKVNEWTDQFSLISTPPLTVSGTAGMGPIPSNSGSDPSQGVKPPFNRGLIAIPVTLVVAVIVALAIFKYRKAALKTQDSNTPPSYSTLSPMPTASESVGKKNVSDSELNEIHTSDHPAAQTLSQSNTQIMNVGNYSNRYNNPQEVSEISIAGGNNTRLHPNTEEHRRGPHAYSPQYNLQTGLSGPQVIASNASNPQYTPPK